MRNHTHADDKTSCEIRRANCGKSWAHGPKLRPAARSSSSTVIVVPNRSVKREHAMISACMLKEMFGKCPRTGGLLLQRFRPSEQLATA